MNITYFFLGVLLMCVAIFLGLYVGVYVLMYQTIVIFLEEPGIWAFVWAVIKWGIAGTGGWFVFLFIGIPAGGLIGRGLR